MKKPYVEREKISANINGIYCIFPFDILEADGSGVFKIGMTTKLDKRLQSYHTALPKGYYKKCVLFNIPFPKTGKFSKSKDLAGFLKMIEKEIFLDIERRGGKVIHIQNRKKKGGRTEWIYVKESVVLEAFDKALDEHGGDLNYWELSKDLKKQVEKLKKDSIFKGEIYFDD